MTSPNPPAGPEPLVLFCNVCNQSVPDSAIEQGCAVRMPDGVAPLVGPATRSRGATAGGGASSWIGVAVLLLAAIAALGLFLDWRLDEGARAASDGVATVDGRVEDISQRLVLLEQRLATTVAASDLRPVLESLDAVARAIPSESAAARSAIDQVAREIEPLRAAIRQIDDAQAQERAQAALLRDDLRQIAAGLAELRARPVAAAPSAAPGSESPAAAPTPAPAPDTLPAALLAHVAQLRADEGGSRFAAVDALLQSGDPRVFEHVLPLVRDPDPFVRRLVFEGLARHRTKASIEALLAGLGDDESFVRHTAYASLRDLSGQDLSFDPDARPSDRSAQERRWRKWWEDAAPTF